MEKGNGSKIIAIVALVLAVAGLTVGFAAYSSTLNITSNANVQVTGNEWDVGFANATGDMAGLTTPTSIAGTGVSSAGTLNMLKYTLSQGTSATLSTSSGSSVTYAFKIKNSGSIDATLDSINSASITCSYNQTANDRVLESDDVNTGKTVTANTSGTISNDDCRTMFTVTLTIDGNSYNLNNLPASYSSTISAGSSVDASLTISATGNNGTTIPTGDFIVTLGTTTVNYKSN